MKIMIIAEITAKLGKQYDPKTNEWEIGAIIYPNTKDEHNKIILMPMNQIKSQWEGNDKQNTENKNARNKINNIKKQIKKDINKIPPILIRRLPKHNTFQVIDGHHRYFAFQEMNVKYIPTIILNANQIIRNKFIENTTPQYLLHGSPNNNLQLNLTESNTTTLNDLYDYDELNDETETLYHWTNPDQFNTPYQIQIMQPNQIKTLTTPNSDITVLDAYKQFATKEQKQLTKYKAKNYNHNRIIIIANNTIIDGNHHAIAAIISNNPVKYINIYEEE
jgi:hypothetical protein